MPVSGKGARNILVVGEAPGAQEDRENRPFVGTSGEFLSDTLSRCGVQLRNDCYITNSLRCRPPGNATPTSSQVDHCRAYLVDTVQTLKPEVIILLGGKAVESLMGWLWKEEVGSARRWVGWQVPCQRLNCWVVPTYHPSAVVRSRGKKDSDTRSSEVMKRDFEKHLRSAVRLAGTGPWPGGVPDYEKSIKRLYRSDEAVAAIRVFLDHGNPVAFDYETDRLKPDHPDARVVSCAVSDGTFTVAFPWSAPVQEAMRELLVESDIPKIGWNKKFEGRWTRRLYGAPVNNWQWDGMLAAHCLDNRPGICSLKYQAFVRLGAEPYDTDIKPYLEPKERGGNNPNRVPEVNLDRLLKYNALDALLTYDLAQIQQEELGLTCWETAQN
jgi:DNA polymerase